MEDNISKYNKCNLNNNMNIFDDNNLQKNNNLEKNLIYKSYINSISIYQNSNCYNKKITELKKTIKTKNNNNSCHIHSLPLNIICIDERKKICGQCALSDIHSNHQIITDDDFIINIELLIKLFNEIDKNKSKYLTNNNSINVKNIIENINLNINQSIELVNKIKQKILVNINKQCEKIINFLNKRKNEIEKKYKNNNFDMNNLKESALKWIKNVNYKLNQIMDINESNIDFIKLIEDEHSKNISYLIRAGKQLKDRLVFAEESIKTIKNLEEFKNNGIKIEPNLKLINNIFKINNNFNEIDDKINKENSYKEDNNIDNYKNEENKEQLEITLFNIEENYNLIKLLHLEHCELKGNNNYKDIINNIEKYKKPEKSLINIDEINIDDTLLISPHRTINTNYTNSHTTTKLMKNNTKNNIVNIIKMENKNETINNINTKTSNYIITKKITGLNNIDINSNKLKIKDSNLRNNSKYQSNRELKNNNIRKIQIKENYIKPLYKMNSKETLFKSYSRSPMNRRNNNFQSINLDKNNWNNNSNNKREKKIKVGLNNRMNNLYKNKESRISPKLFNKKKNIISNKNDSTILTKRSSKEKDSLNTLNTGSYKKKNLKINNSKLSLRNHGSKKSFSSLYSDQNILDLNSNKLSNYDIKNGDKNENYIKLDIFNHYNNEDIKNKENINNSNKNTNILLKKQENNNVIIDKNNISEIKSKIEQQNIILTQMKTLSPNFSRINMNGLGIQLICSYLHKNPNKNYKEIKLLGSNLSDDDLFLLIKTLLDHNINILILNLSNNNISDESASSILDLVKEHRTLKTLYLYNNPISDLLKEKLKEYTELGREDLHNIQLYI